MRISSFLLSLLIFSIVLISSIILFEIDSQKEITGFLNRELVEIDYSLKSGLIPHKHNCIHEQIVNSPDFKLEFHEESNLPRTLQTTTPKPIQIVFDFTSKKKKKKLI